MHNTNNLAHLDLKAENIVITDSLDIALIDFCFSKDSEKPISILIGTRFYMAPEILSKMHETMKKPFIPKQADIFSLGICLFNIIYCHAPYRERNSNCYYHRLIEQGLL